MISQKLGRTDELSVLARAIPDAEGEPASRLRVERPAAKPRAQQSTEPVAGSPWQTDLVTSRDATGSWRRGRGALANVQAAVDYVALSVFVVAVLGLPLTAVGFMIGLV